MAILIPCRGNVYKVDPTAGFTDENGVYSGAGSNGDIGFYRVEGLEAKKGPGDALLIMSVSPQKSDVVAPIITLENTRILYSFGANFGNITISGMVLLGKSGSPGQSLKTIVDFFESNRVSKSTSPINVTGPSVAWKVFLTGLSINEADSVNNTQPFALTGIIAEPK
jgi:hypothetical protein